MNLLILGGTTEASTLAGLVAADARFDATISLAGTTRHPKPQPLPCRIGGFGGVAGLAAYLREHCTDALIDATHPFAAQISRHAVDASRAGGTELLAIVRPAWTAQPGDRWHLVADMQEAATALGAAPRRVLLTIGQKELAPFAPPHRYVVRSVDPPTHPPAGAIVLSARGPFIEADELRLLKQHAIEVIVTKNAGGSATAPKLAAARALGIEVIMVARPVLPETKTVETAEAAMHWLRHALTLRGE